MNLEQSYSILQVAPGASLEDIKKSYRSLAFQYHPDLHQNDPGSSRKFQELNEAFVTLKNHLEEDRTKSSYRTFRGKQKTQTGKKEPSGSGESRQGFYYRKEEVLRDILNDPFARKVFEDIYSQIRREESHQKGASAGSTSKMERTLDLELGKRKIKVDVGSGLFKGIRSWITGQLDDQQTMYIPFYQIVPGTRIQIQVSHRWSGPPKDVEVTIPPDYLPGKPLRLKGLGRKIGPFQGDLYLKIRPR